MKIKEYPQGYLIRAEAKGEPTTKGIIIRICLLLMVIWLALSLIPETNRDDLVSPCPTGGCQPVVTPTPTPENTPIPTPEAQKTGFVSGLASYYSREGCLGCNPNFITASGEILDDTKQTMALPPEFVKKHKLMGKTLKVTNKKTNIAIDVKVNDTGGFSKYGRIADLSLASKNSLGCGGLCEVVIEW